MRMYLVGGLLAIVITAILAQRSGLGVQPTKVELVATPEPTMMPITTVSPTTEPTTMVTPFETSKVTPVATNTPTLRGQLNNLTNWKYPGCTTKATTQTKLTLTCMVDHQLITQWYQQKIKTDGYSSRTSVSTETNGVILDSLKGQKGQQSISIVIRSSTTDKNELAVEIEAGSVD